MVVNNLVPLTVFTCLASAYLVSCQFADYIGDDLDEYELYENGYDAIEHNAIGSTYFDPYSGDYDWNYGDSFVGKTPDVKDCERQLDGSPSFNGTRPCDIQIQGLDKAAPLLPGGMDGAYKLATCANGRPLYKRITTDKAGERVLWYSSRHEDWDISNGSVPLEEDILMWGGFAGKETRPQQVQKAWHFAAEFMANYNPAKSPEYAEVNVTVACVAGSNEEAQQPPPALSKWKPLLTDEEQDEQYWAVIKQGRENLDANSGANTGLILVFVATGLGTVVGLPVLIARRRGKHKGPGDKGIIIEVKELLFGKQGHSS